MGGEFRLSGLEYLGKEYNKKKFKNLDTKYVQRIYRTQIAVNILDARSPKNVIYDIFRRVNTGGVNLNPQEMRNAICKQEVRDFLVRSTQNENYVRATRGRVKDDRMDSQELVLRFYAFYKAYNYEKNVEKMECRMDGFGSSDDSGRVRRKKGERAGEGAGTGVSGVYRRR